MKLYLPEIYPDELVYSWFSRYAVYEGFPANMHALEALFCDRQQDDPSKEFIGNINGVTRDYIDKTYSMNDFVLSHTMYAEYARFIPQEQKLVALYKLGYEHEDVHHLLPIIPRGKKEQYLKYCPICAKEDRNLYGETYWHRKHQIRNMMICAKHKCMLEDSNVFVNSKSSRMLIAAEMVIPYSELYMEVKNPLQIQYAEYIEQIFDAPMDFSNDVPLRVILHNCMKNTAYMQPTGRYRYTTKFVEDIHQYYKQININEVASKSMIQNMLIGNVFDFATVCQIGFFLHISVKDLTLPQLTEKHILQEKMMHYTEPNWQQYDSDMADIMKKTVTDIYYGRADKRGKPGKVMETVICRKLDIMLHEIKNLPQCKAILDKYLESYQELWARRLVWAYDMLAEEKGEDNFCWKDLKKLSGVVKNRFDEILPYLRKYTDEDKIGKIMEVIFRER